MITVYQDNTDLLFPDRLIPSLADLRSAGWQALIRRVASTDSNPVERTAFVLMMVRLNTCASCNADSYRAMQGCLACSQQTLKRFRGTDEELIEMFDAACQEVETYLARKK